MASDKIYPGMSLKIPISQEVEENSPDVDYTEYTVKKGDTLWKIAQKQLGYGKRYTEIKDMNNLGSDEIYPGQILKLPKK